MSPIINPKPFLRALSLRQNHEMPPINFEQYPFCIPAVRQIEKVDFHADVTFLVGENGAGKSTLLEAIALASGFGSEGGTKKEQFETAATISPLSHYLSLTQGRQRRLDGYFLRAESFYNVATHMDQTGYLFDYGGKSLHERSHGEAFMALLTTKFRGHGLYLLDEPEAALSPQRQLAALSAIHQLVNDHSQFIIATHSPILMSYPRAKIFLCDASGIRQVAYEETEHYRITKKFLNDYKAYLHHLLD